MYCTSYYTFLTQMFILKIFTFHYNNVFLYLPVSLCNHFVKHLSSMKRVPPEVDGGVGVEVLVLLTGLLFPFSLCSLSIFTILNEHHTYHVYFLSPVWCFTVLVTCISSVFGTTDSCTLFLCNQSCMWSSDIRLMYVKYKTLKALKCWLFQLTI